MRDNEPVTQKEYPLNDDDFLISRTNLKGRITYANPAFIEVSGFSREELTGAPQNIIRHPDMPESVYEDLWKTIESGHSWKGIIKNRRKDGDHYWVESSVSPLLEDGEVVGYASVRLKANRDDIDKADKAYAAIRAGKASGLSLHRGEIRRRGLAGTLERLNLGSVRARLVAMVMVAALLVTASGGMGLFALQQAGDRLQVMDQDGLQDVARLQQISQRATEAHQLLAGNSRVMLLDEKDQHIDSLQSISTTMETLWDEYRGRTGSAAGEADSLDAMVSEYRSAGIGEAIALLQSDDRFDVFTNLPRHIDAMQRMGESLSARIGTAIEGERNDATTLAADGRAEQTYLLAIQAGLMATGLLILVVMGTLTFRRVTRPLDDARQFTLQIASGNLGADEPAARKDEFGQLFANLRIMRLSLGNIIGDVNGGVGVVNPAARDIAAGNEDISARTEQQASSLQETASSMEEITTTVQHNSDNARQASTLASENAERSQNTKALMHDVVETMDQISQSSHHMRGILDMIDSIAFQTNILALNASVEAARAGEQGRGFAVVASEVRQLASRSADAAREIRELINGSTRQIDGGADRVREAEESLIATMEAATRVNDIMEEIKTASEEQSNGVRQINQSITEIDQVTQQNATRIQATARAATELEQQADLLGNAVAAFRLRGAGMEQVPSQAGQQRPAAPQSRHEQPAATATTHRTDHRQSSAVEEWEEF